MEEEEIVVSDDTEDVTPLDLSQEPPMKETTNSGEEGDQDEDEFEERSAAPNSGHIRRVRLRRAFIKARLLCGKTGHNLNNCPKDLERYRPMHTGSDGISSPSDEDDEPDAAIAPHTRGGLRHSERKLGGKKKQLR